MVKDAARRDQDAENIIADPSAELPDDWEVEEDGEWEAPKVPNPACAAKGPLDAGGCGKWAAPVIPNPAYKGKWYAAQIDNPEYKGVWAPRQIDNPNFFGPGRAACLRGLGVFYSKSGFYGGYVWVRRLPNSPFRWSLRWQRT
jgi:calnexin